MSHWHTDDFLWLVKVPIASSREEHKAIRDALVFAVPNAQTEPDIGKPGFKLLIRQPNQPRQPVDVKPGWMRVVFQCPQRAVVAGKFIVFYPDQN